jgi:hypothetical protein
MNAIEITRNKIPAHLHCIYFLISKGEIVYVGKSGYGGFDRIGQHLKYSDKVFDSYFIESCKEEEILNAETEYIVKFNPKYNKSIPTNKKYATASAIISMFNFWTKEKLYRFIGENEIKLYGEKYFLVADFSQRLK